MLTEKRFQKREEDFVCINCGRHVKGNGYTDHCPYCLTSLHVDINPGDRASDCKGVMRPIHAEYKHGEFIITYKCEHCGMEKKVKAAKDDNIDLLMALVNK